MSHIKPYRFDLLITVALLALFAAHGGLITATQFMVIVIIEISLSFDNAIVNAVVLKKMSHGWQRGFIWGGIWIAVFGMRFAFPVLIVSLTAGISNAQVINLALNDTSKYTEYLLVAHPEIATLGLVYLGMIFLNYFLSEHESYWLAPVEKTLVKIGKADTLSAAIMLVSILFISFNKGGDEGSKILITGVVSLALFLVVQLIGSIFETEDEEGDEAHPGMSTVKKVHTGIAGLGLFIYLEVQDAAFSFDGVSGAFAITTWIPLIMAGLGVGALFVRSMTVHLVETNQLDEFKYLENGAHWAIGALAACITASLYVDVPQWVTGPLGALFIIASLVSSIRFNKAEAKAELAAVTSAA